MRLLHKAFVFTFLIAVAAPSILAESIAAPVDRKGFSIGVEDAGAIGTGIDASTGTVAIICGSTNPNESSLTKRGIVYGVIVSSIAHTSYLVFRDSDTGNLTSTTKTVVYANQSTDLVLPAGSYLPRTLTIKFPVPIQFANGISVNASAAPTQAGYWTILYRLMD